MLDLVRVDRGIPSAYLTCQGLFSARGRAVYCACKDKCIFFHTVHGQWKSAFSVKGAAL